MSSLYERQYRKVAELAAIVDGSHSIFETGGTKLKVARRGEGAVAFDITDGLPSETGTAPQKELPAEVRDGWVWVCIDLCS